MAGILAGESFHLSTCDETKKLINTLYEKIDELDDDMKTIIRKEKRSIDQMSKIPVEEYVEYTILLSQSSQILVNAKINNDFNTFAPTLEKIV